ncbi:Periplasmic serine endoprotease DegP precursor [Symmachiella macrocystis]|uniref:Periplasmic serine endoprotease DegP n=1 Tax=Symmachiella macrocystis TaxID=2527985 RepID=A0A5C6B573_9PLAN|nr:trypsin-like peptidase domain-containing protein [Symmachiella macrocystis]TWU07090.1 Periplasmic serine endoprotease DegP precursor [Symmachiella macrocystis]
MKRSTCIIASIGCLLSGIIVGASFNGWTPSNSLQAKSPIYLTADETYAKLSQTDSPILQGSERIAEVSRLTMPSVVHIQCVRHVSGRTVEETGSGVIIRNDTTKARGTFVVTNLHVIRGTPRNEIHIRLFDGRELQPLQVWSDERSDIAVMKIEADNLQAARWGNSEVLDIGHMVLALGSPFGLSQSVTFGIVSAKSRRSLNLGKQSRILNQNFLQTDAAINPGNSGGPLVNLRGEIVGINTAIASSSGGNEGIGFSIPSSLVRRVVTHLLEYGQVRRAYIGVRLNEDFDIDVARNLKLDRVRGAHVLIVYPNTPASDANLQREDVILSVDNVDVHDLNHLINLISLKEIGTSVNLVVFREGKRMRAELKVIDLDRSQRSAEMSTPLIPGKEAPKVDLGLSLQPLDDSLADQLGLGTGTAGLLVLNVDADGPLAAADLQLYDVIEEVSRKSVDSVDAFQTALQTSTAKPLLLKVRRQTNGKSTSHLVLMNP